MENLNKIKNKVEEMKAKYSLEQEQEENPNHSDGFGMYWSGFFTCLKEISFFLDSFQQEQQEIGLKKFTEKMDNWKARFSRPNDIPIKATMVFTARMFYIYPKVAREWYENLLKTTLD